MITTPVITAMKKWLVIPRKPGEKMNMIQKQYYAVYVSMNWPLKSIWKAIINALSAIISSTRNAQPTTLFTSKYEAKYCCIAYVKEV